LAGDNWDDGNQFKVSEKIPIILAPLALAFILAHLWLGPICTDSDCCICGRQRIWLAFDYNPRLTETKFFLRITSPGDPNHKHECTDPQYDTNAALGYIGVGFLLASVLIWTWPSKQASVHG
jgi:hypothetical protein